MVLRLLYSRKQGDMMSKKKSVAKKTKAVRYPWDKWFSQKSFRVVRGKHYHCQTHSMAQQIRNFAGENNIGVSIRIKEDTITTKIDAPFIW